MKMTVVYPPFGRLYDFPKNMPSGLEKQWQINEWLIANGYPAYLIKDMGYSFKCSTWLSDTDEPIEEKVEEVVEEELPLDEGEE